MTTLTVTDNSFGTDVLETSGTVIVDFWADHCAPCHQIAPILEQLSDEYAGRLKIAKVNIDQNVTTATQYGVRSIPTLMIFQNGSLIATKVGALSKHKLKNWIDGTVGP